jgi:beta-glucosidase
MRGERGRRSPLALRNHLVAGAAAFALVATLVNCTSSSTSAMPTTTPTSAAFPVINNSAAIAKAQAMVAQMSQADMLTLVEGTSKASGDTIVSAGYAAPVNDGAVVIPALYEGDSPNGVGNGNVGVTQFPTAQSVASTWDVTLAKAYGDAIGAEWAGKAENCGLGPAMNIIRLPYGGRSAEYLSEDPYLAGQIAANEALGIQGNGVIATAKHFALNNQEDDRSGVNVIASERAIREIYMPAFETTLKLGGAMAVMPSYNQVNGQYAAENPHLLTDILRTDWGYNGFTMSDWGACHSTVQSANAGLDQEMPGGTYYTSAALSSAITAGTVTTAKLQEMATHILTAMYQAGIPFTKGTPSATVSTAAHRALGVQVSEDGSVLLQNDGTLPLAKTARIAVIGPCASAYPENDIGGSGAVSAVATVVTPLAGIQTEVGTGLVTYAQGSIGTGSLPILTAATGATGSATIVTTSGGSTPGFAASFKDSTNTDIAATDGTTTTSINYGFSFGASSIASWPDSLGSGSTTGWKADFVGYMTIPAGTATTTYDFNLAAGGAANLIIDGTTRITVSSTTSSNTTTGISLAAGTHKIEVTEDTTTYSWPSFYGFMTEAPTLALSWNPSGQYLTAALANAEAADVAVVCIGDAEAEGSDHSAYLSADQNALVQSIAAVAKKTVVVLNAGSPLIYPWANKVDAILDNHYGGEDLGTAIAALLYGDVNPSGKLTVTHAASEGQLYGQTAETYPGVELAGDSNLTVTYAEDINVGYRWFDKQGLQPAFPFGHGLSYTSFSYSNLKVSPGTGDGSSVTVAVDLKNTGAVTGKEVAQLYVGFPSSAGEPPKQLKGFQKVSLASGAGQTLTFTLDPRSFSYWGANGWTIDPGQYTLYVGSSSQDIRQVGTYTVTQ